MRTGVRPGHLPLGDEPHSRGVILCPEEERTGSAAALITILTDFISVKTGLPQSISWEVRRFLNHGYDVEAS